MGHRCRSSADSYANYSTPVSPGYTVAIGNLDIPSHSFFYQQAVVAAPPTPSHNRRWTRGSVPHAQAQGQWEGGRVKMASVGGTWRSRKTEESVPPAEEESGRAGISGGCEMEKTRRRSLVVAFTAQGPEQARPFQMAT